MPKIIWSLFILILLTSISYGQNEGEKTDTNNEVANSSALANAPMPAVQVMTPKFINGEVLSIDNNNTEVTVLTIKEINGEEIQIEVNPNLSITKIISPSELNLGDNLRITYEEKDDKKTARNIFLGRPRPTRTEPAP